MTFDENIIHPDVTRPHLVILGAGASRQAFPNGDRNGKPLPLMNDKFVDIVGLGPLLTRHNVAHAGEWFEPLYGKLADDPTQARLVADLEAQTAAYFRQLELPDEPTLYDHLVLSLREKDVIATFNWDPLLFQAAKRNHGFATPPRLLFLHGNVGVGICLRDRKIGPAKHLCPGCTDAFTDSKLLYPIEKKNYANDPYIKAAWDEVRDVLRSAYLTTIFGYGAPTSDKEAVELMRAAWGNAEERNLEEWEMIDIKDAETLRATWDPFIHTHHYRTTTDFYQSLIAQFPRRSCEAIWKMAMETTFLSSTPFPIDASFEKLYALFKPLVDAE